MVDVDAGYVPPPNIQASAIPELPNSVIAGVSVGVTVLKTVHVLLDASTSGYVGELVVVSE